MSGAMTAAMLAALLFGGLTAGFLFAFAVVVMPGIRKLDDHAYLRAFQVMDGIIQGNSPLFIIMWVGSVVAMLAVLVLGLMTTAGPGRMLLVGAAGIYLVGVQLPTAAVNIPLNNRVQNLQIEELDPSAARMERDLFEPRWNRWNVIRTFVAVGSLAMLLAAFVV